VDLPSLRDVGRSVGEAVLDGVGRASARLQERRPLAADVLESDDAYLVVFDAPGAEREDLQVRYEDDTVAVRVDRFREFQEGFETRVPGRGLALSGSVTLPEGAAVNADAAEATLTDSGTLRVLVPKREPSGGDEERTVEIEDEEVEEEPADHDEHDDDA
jgi:HSP20 family molecular chaperone IbpA